MRLYLRYPLLFIGLAAAVVVPYGLLVLVIAKTSPLGQESISTSTALILALVQFAFVGPLISALQVRAVLMIGDHEQPSFIEVVKRGLPTLPVVAAAEIIAGIGIGIGLLLFVIPGVILALRWAVVAQVAAIERTDWPGALRRSAELTAATQVRPVSVLPTRNYLRVFAILVCISLVNLTLSNVGGAIIGTRTRVAEVVAGIVIMVLEFSFQALTVAVLYFDLRARERLG